MELKYINTYNTNPHRNLAFEEYLFENIGENECILYLWQNAHTVVIGKNQNAFKECKVSALEGDGGFLARRPSGGGAVYHDLGNLNFTFITTDKYYDVDKQLKVIIEAVGAFGIVAQKTGRNDICIDGRKFSGNAFLSRDGKRYHHGTILVDVDMQKLSAYLNVSGKKLQAKGVDSVKSRVVNLSALNGNITIEAMRKELVAAFEKVYVGTAAQIKEEDMDKAAVDKLLAKYNSGEWRYGDNKKCDYEINEKFFWGEISVQMGIKGNIIEDVKVYTDAMEVDFAPVLEEALCGAKFSKDAMIERISRCKAQLGQIATDLAELISREEI